MMSSLVSLGLQALKPITPTLRPIGRQHHYPVQRGFLCVNLNVMITIHPTIQLRLQAQERKPNERNMKSAFKSKFELFMVAALMATGNAIAAGPESSFPTTQDQDMLPWEKGSIKAGGFLTAFDSNISLGLKGAGISIDGESLLGLQSTLVVWRAEAMIRPGRSRRHQFDFSYSSFDRNGTTTLNEEIEIGDEILVPGTTISSVFDFDIYRLTYSYALLQDDRMRIAIGLGAYVIPLRYGIDVQTTDSRRVVEFDDFDLPLPSLALRGEFQLVPKLFLNMEVNAMYLEISDFKGSLMDANIGLEYRPWKHFGLGLAYNPLSVHVESSEQSNDYPGADFLGTVDVNYSGLLFYAKYSF